MTNTNTNTAPSEAKATILLICFLGGFVVLIASIIILNFYIMAVGFVMFGIGVIALSWSQGAQEAGYRRGGSGSGGGGGSGSHSHDSFYLNRWGSYQAKKNMRRGHRYSKK